MNFDSYCDSNDALVAAMDSVVPPQPPAQMPPHPAGPLPRHNGAKRARASDAAPVPAGPILRVLHCFSGPASRRDGLKAFLVQKGAALGYPVVCTDVDIVNDVDEQGCVRKEHENKYNLMNDQAFKQLCGQCARGDFDIGFFGIVCSSFSVVRNNQNGVQGSVPLRDRENPLGLPNLSATDRHKLERANELTRRSIILVALLWGSGGDFLIENPVDFGARAREDRFREDAFYQKNRDHCPLWLLPWTIALRLATGTGGSHRAPGKELVVIEAEDYHVDFSQCLLRAESTVYDPTRRSSERKEVDGTRKDTRLLCSRGLKAGLKETFGGLGLCKNDHTHGTSCIGLGASGECNSKKEVRHSLEHMIAQLLASGSREPHASWYAMTGGLPDAHERDARRHRAAAAPRARA